MQEVLYLERIEQAEILLKPARIAILRRLAEPRSCTELGEAIGVPAQKVYYHIKRLEEADLVERVAQRRVRGILEGVYQARARSYWLSPALVGRIGPRRLEHARGQGFLLDLAETFQADVARLAAVPGEGATIGLAADVRLLPEQRAAFLHDLQAAMQDLLTRYGGAEGEPFQVIVAAYPKEES